MHYDSRPATLFHSQRVGELMVQVVKEALDQSTCHDRSKTESPEVEVFDDFTPKLKTRTYGSDLQGLPRRHGRRSEASLGK
jgi:hypothetical protein